jgi:hypothetical protein
MSSANAPWVYLQKRYLGTSQQLQKFVIARGFFPKQSPSPTREGDCFVSLMGSSQRHDFEVEVGSKIS